MSPGVGDLLDLVVGPVAHGGHCVARHEGQVVFVRHALPGERVTAQVTGIGGGGRFLHADAVGVQVAAPGRREAPCPYSGPGGCGGCDWQHAEPEVQRALKEDVLAEAMRRQGGVEVRVPVEPVPGDRDGLAWRTRVGYAVDDEGRAGLRRYHSHDIVPVERCLLATDAVDATGVTRLPWPGATSVSVVATSAGEAQVTVEPAGARVPEALPEAVGVTGVRGPSRLHERVGEFDYIVSARSFWQVHPGAPAVLTEAVLEALVPRAGDHVLDLYSGVGLFALPLAEAVGPGGRIEAVESDPAACACARRAMHDRPTVRVHEERVDRWLAARSVRRCDLVVLDPPEAGAGRTILERVVRLSPRRIAYVACDPVALARDVRVLGELGWKLTGLRAFDLFPTTHHLEAVAAFEPA